MKDKKIILHAIGNHGNYNYYIFDKKQKVIEVLSKILAMDFDAYFDEMQYKKNKINMKTDLHMGTGDIYDKINFDIFFGGKKIFLTVNCSENLRLKFNESLFKYATMPKYKFRKNTKINKNKKEILGPFRYNKNFIKNPKNKFYKKSKK